MIPAIRADDLGKSYRVNHAEERLPYKTLRDSLARLATAPMRRWRAGGHSGVVEQFWALRDVSFDVQPGEVVGIIGRNGAGKSTLLKILSRITKPTTGRVAIRGRVGSLLEVGTGFHPELTGRENIYMNGSILGMSRSEIKGKFDEIVEFSGVGRFLDMPVKRYSSGMQVRLAFAVAAHLDPQILIIDEVLAVGDANFQQKCLGKMGEVASEGRTILFVSHDLKNVLRLCRHGILLSAGRVEAYGDASEVVHQYLCDGAQISDGTVDLSQRNDRSGSGRAQFRSIEITQNSHVSNKLAFGAAIAINLTVEVREFVGPASVAVVITTAEGSPVHDLWNDEHPWSGEIGLHEFEIVVPNFRLYPGDYIVNLWMGDSGSERIDYVQSAAKFEVVQTSESGVSRRLCQTNGVVYQEARWSSKRLASHSCNQT
jgi:lipopolysaccharide transport system ATP-binding protein